MASSEPWSLHSQAKCCPKTKHAAKRSASGVCGLAILSLRFDAMFMQCPICPRRPAGDGTQTASVRVGGEKKPWPMWEYTRQLGYA